jgi:hypothetical protein
MNFSLIVNICKHMYTTTNNNNNNNNINQRDKSILYLYNLNAFIIQLCQFVFVFFL